MNVSQTFVGTFAPGRNNRSTTWAEDGTYRPDNSCEPGGLMHGPPSGRNGDVQAQNKSPPPPRERSKWDSLYRAAADVVVATAALALLPQLLILLPPTQSY
jgi:hypothetical protein